MVFYTKGPDGKWSPIYGDGSIIARKGLTQWSNIDHEKTKVFHQKLERKWQSVK